MFAVILGGKASDMQTPFAVITDLVPLLVVAVFVIAAAVDPFVSMRQRLQRPQPRRQAQRAHGTHA